MPPVPHIYVFWAWSENYQGKHRSHGIEWLLIFLGDFNQTGYMISLDLGGGWGGGVPSVSCQFTEVHVKVREPGSKRGLIRSSVIGYYTTVYANDCSSLVLWVMRVTCSSDADGCNHQQEPYYLLHNTRNLRVLSGSLDTSHSSPW